MKLNNQQVSALADKIHADISLKISAENKELKNDIAKYGIWARANKKYIEALANIQQNTKILESLGERCYHSRYFAEMNIPDKLKNKFTETLKLNYPPQIGTIKADIILETIECENLDSIITKLVDKYTK